MVADPQTPGEFLNWLTEANGFYMVRARSDGRWSAIVQSGANFEIVKSAMMDTMGVA
jgi:hypothetical protein